MLHWVVWEKSANVHSMLDQHFFEDTKTVVRNALNHRAEQTDEALARLTRCWHALVSWLPAVISLALAAVADYVSPRSDSGQLFRDVG